MLIIQRALPAHTPPVVTQDVVVDTALVMCRLCEGGSMSFSADTRSKNVSLSGTESVSDSSISRENISPMSKAMRGSKFEPTAVRIPLVLAFDRALLGLEEVFVLDFLELDHLQLGV